MCRINLKDSICVLLIWGNVALNRPISQATDSSFALVKNADILQY